MHPFCEAYLCVYVMTFIILFLLIVAIVMLGQFLDILMSIGPHCPLNDTHISLQTPYCAHPFCEAYLRVYVMTFIILFWLIVAIGGHAGAIFGYFDEHWTALASHWCLYLFTDIILHASALWGLSMGIDKDFNYFIIVDWGNRLRCCYHFWTLISKAFLVYNYFIFGLGIENSSLFCHVRSFVLRASIC